LRRCGRCSRKLVRLQGRLPSRADQLSQPDAEGRPHCRGIASLNAPGSVREIELEGVLLITGGTGSFGHAVLKRFLDSGVDEIRIFSRDEKKQDDMRKRYASAKLKFYIGDVRDRRSLAAAVRSVDYCFHAAALKQVP